MPFGRRKAKNKITKMSVAPQNKTLFFSTLLIVVVHLAGYIGIHSSYQQLFLSLTPISLLVSIGMLFLNHKQFNNSFFVFCGTAFISEFLIEIIGVKTGDLFGDYNYGNTLGFKIFDVPIVIGINWLMLVYCAGSICSKLKTTIFIKSLAGAVMLVVLDFFIEPVAMKYDFWSWKNDIIPLQNFIVWFLFSFLLLLFFNKSKFNKENKLASTLYIVQLVFFILMGLKPI